MEKEKILFRASEFGNLMTEGKGSQFTPENAERISELEYERDNLLNKNGNKIKWTTNKQEELDKLIAKRDAPPQLSETAKSEVKKIWRQNEKGFVESLDNKYIMKGLFSEQEGVELISDIEGNFYIKNTERITKGNLTGEADIIFVYNSFDELPEWRKLVDDGNTKFPLKVVKDVKCSYDLRTFMNADFSSLYEYQGRCYLLLYDADEFHLQYCLVDLPEHLYNDEIWKAKNKYGVIDIEEESVKPLFDQIKRNFIYSDNPNYTKEERLKSYWIRRDRNIEVQMLEKIPLALEFYKTITTNQI